MSQNKIPEQLHSYPLIRVCPPDCSVHQQNCSGGKRPVTSSADDEPLPNIRQWISEGGNYGVVARDTNNLLIFDSDARVFSHILSSNLPKTFTVTSGGRGFGEHWYFKCDDIIQNTSWSNPEGSLRTGGNNGWFVVGPGSKHAQTNREYEVSEDQAIAEITKEELKEVTDILDKEDGSNSENTTNGNNDPSSVTHNADGTLGFIKRDDKREEIEAVLRNGTHNERVWMVGWLHGAAGLHKNEIVDLIMKKARWDNLTRNIVEKQVESVLQSANNTRGTHYEQYSPSTS